MVCILQRGQGRAPAYPTRRPQRCPWKATSGHRTDARIRSTHGYADAGTEISPQKLQGEGADAGCPMPVGLAGRHPLPERGCWPQSFQ